MPEASGPPAATPPTAHHLDHEGLVRWYGGFDPLDPSTIRDFMDGFDRPWWVIGGWSIEAFTGVPREHEDMDISILASDATAFRLFLGDRWHPWNVDDGWFRPFDERFPDVRPDSQLWIRRDAQSRWVPRRPGSHRTQTDVGRTSVISPTEDLDDVTWVGDDGLRYARPEVTLMFKSKQERAKDVRDAEITLPMLDDAARRWLSDTIAHWDAEHPWVV